MIQSLPGAILAMAVGAGAALLNAALTEAVLRKKPDRVAAFFAVRQVINVGCLVIVFFVSKLLPWDSRYMLVGAAVGLTVPSLILSLRLSRRYSAQAPGTENSETKGEE